MDDEDKSSCNIHLLSRKHTGGIIYGPVSLGKLTCVLPATRDCCNVVQTSGRGTADALQMERCWKFAVSLHSENFLAIL